MTLFTLSRRAALAAAFLALATISAAMPAKAEPRLTPELAAVRERLAKYRDPVAAVRDGYFSTLGCVRYEGGAMGVHFLNPAHIGPEVDPARPQILVYEPVGGRLELVAAEWFVPLATGVKARPAIFGQPFNGPMAGHEPLMPESLHHYDLHVWLFKENPAGTFAPTNPAVSCEGYAYDFLEQPPAHVSHQAAQAPAN
ncbi:MAG: hypothetical protein Kow00114_19380 [Kiloniellaceae bacterium]